MATSDFAFVTSLEQPAQRDVFLSREKYDIVYASIIEILRIHGPMTFTQLGHRVEERLQDGFDGSVLWYFTIVKLDMEACGEIQRVVHSKHQLLSLSA